MYLRLLSFLVVSIFLFSACKSGKDCPKEIDQQPMYGHAAKCADQLKADRDFYEACDKRFPTRDSAYRYYLGKGWEYFNTGDLPVAMKRFNQAWLLDSNNMNTYWGFAATLGKWNACLDANYYFKYAIKMAPTNGRLWRDAAVVYHQCFVKTKDTKWLDTCITYFKTSLVLDSSDKQVFGIIAAEYSYHHQKDSALKYLILSDSIDPGLVPDDIRKAINE